MPVYGEMPDFYAIEDTSLYKGQQANYLNIHYPKQGAQYRLKVVSPVFIRPLRTGYNNPVTINGSPLSNYGTDCRTDM